MVDILFGWAGAQVAQDSWNIYFRMILNTSGSFRIVLNARNKKLHTPTAIGRFPQGAVYFSGGDDGVVIRGAHPGDRGINRGVGYVLAAANDHGMWRRF